MCHENLKLEVHEKIRSGIRGYKILPDLLELCYKSYIIGIVRLRATSFMLQVFVFMQAWASCRFELKTCARKKKPRTGTKLSCLGLFWRFWPFLFWFPHPLFCFCTPLRICFIFHISFYIFIFIYFIYFFWIIKIMKNIFFIFFILFYFFIIFGIENSLLEWIEFYFLI